MRIGSHPYYIRKRLAGHQALLILNATAEVFDIWVRQNVITTKPIKGLYHGEMPLADYNGMMVEEARSEERQMQQKRRRQSSVA